MNDPLVIRKLNEMIVVQAAALNCYQSLGETSNAPEIVGNFANFASVAKEILVVLGGIVESFGGEVIDNFDGIARDLKLSFESVINDGSFNDNETFRFFLLAYLVEGLNCYNWFILKDLAEEEEDYRLEAVRSSAGKVEEIHKWLKGRLSEISLSELR